MTTETKHTPTPLIEGDKVITNAVSIDGKIAADQIGYVHGFARFSKYHAREVWVSSHSEENRLDAIWGGWFWERDISPLDAALVKAKAGAA